MCQQTCVVPREECGHPCGLRCHGDAPCKKTPCQMQVSEFYRPNFRTTRTECKKVLTSIGGVGVLSCFKFSLLKGPMHINIPK